MKEIKQALGLQAAYDTAVLWESGLLWIVPDEYKTEGMSNPAVRRKPYTLMYVPDDFKMQEMCDKAVKDDSSFLQFVPDWFVTQEQIKIRHDNGDHWDDDGGHWDDKFFEQYDGYKKRKAQKAQIKKELMAISLHPSRWWDWRMSEEKKKETEQLWA